MIISRSCYLKEPEKWFGTKEEKEVVALSVDYINNNTIPSNKPVWIEGKVLYDNSVAIHMVTKLRYLLMQLI